MKYDTLIRQALVIDGSNTEGFVTDVGVRGGRIQAMGDLSADEAAHVIDEHGLVYAYYQPNA